MSIEPLVTRTTVELASSQRVIPGFARVVFFALHKIHRFWRWIRLGNIYRNPDNFAQLAAGHGLNYLAGESILIRTSAICTLIASRILNAVSEYEKLLNVWADLKNAVWNYYPSPIKYSWDQKHRFFSLSTILWIKTSTKSAVLRAQLIAMSLFRVVKHAALLSLRLIDATEAFTLSPSAREEGVNLLFVNSATCLSKLVENKDFLLESLRSHQELINKILLGLGAVITADRLIHTVEQAIDGTRRSTETLSERVSEFIGACGKKWTYAFLDEVGLRHLAPNALAHTEIAPWDHPQRREQTERFPPENWIRQTPARK